MRKILILYIIFSAVCFSSCKKNLKKENPYLPYTVGVIYEFDPIAYKIANINAERINQGKYLGATRKLMDALYHSGKESKEEQKQLDDNRGSRSIKFLKVLLKEYLKMDFDTAFPSSIKTVGFFIETPRTYDSPNNKEIKIFREYINSSKNFQFIKNLKNIKQDFIIKIINYGDVRRSQYYLSKDENIGRVSGLYLIEIIHNKTKRIIIKKLYTGYFSLRKFMSIVMLYLVKNPYRPFK